MLKKKVTGFKRDMSRNQCLLRLGKVNNWVGLLGDKFLGPVVLPKRLTGEAYHRFLVNDLPVLLGHVLLLQGQHTWFMNDGTPPHFLCIVRKHLNQTLNEKCIGCRDPINWPA